MATIISNKKSSNIMIINVLTLVFLISKSKVPKLTPSVLSTHGPDNLSTWPKSGELMCFILDGQMAMSLMKIPYIPHSHAIPIPLPGPSVAKRSAGISKFDQVKFNFRILCGLT